jgi:hypothetical protein
MLRVRAIGLGVAAVAAVAGIAAAPASQAATVKLSGKLGARLPRPAAGVALVQAVNVGDGTLGAAQYIGRRGRFSLKVPPGPYGLVAGSVFFKRGVPTVKLRGALRASAGKPRRLALSAATGAQKIVGVPYFTGGEAYQNRGLASMVETDLVLVKDGPPCAFTVVALQRRDEIIKEIRRQQTKFFDPATRVRPGRLLQPTIVVRGSLVSHGEGDVSYNLQVVNTKNGKVKGTVSGRTTPTTWLSASEGIARQLAKIICQPDDLYFRIVGYSRTEKSTTSHGEHTGTDTLPAPGPVAQVPECTDPTTCAKVFVVEATVTSVFTGKVTGTANPFLCPGGSFDYGTSTLQNPLRQTIEFDPDGTAPAATSAGMVPSVGDVIEDKCGANDSGDPQAVGASVPAADLLSGNPVTFSFSGAGSTPSFGDHPGTPVNWSLSETLTVQRVQADGSHI